MPHRTVPEINVPKTPGTYALILSSLDSFPLQIGKKGKMSVKPGYYVYIGSAFGSGGLAARLGHHIKIAKRPRWHIDYLRAKLKLIAIWLTTDRQHREHQWARCLAEYQRVSMPLARFGASDCNCSSHLFYFATQPRLKTFQANMLLTCPQHAEIIFCSCKQGLSREG